MTSLVFPLHDPKNIETPFLRSALPILKANFKNAFVSVTPKTTLLNPEAVKFLEQDDFFVVNFNPEDSLMGDHFVAGYRSAVSYSEPDQILHLCNTDRLVYAVLTDFKDSFLGDTNGLVASEVPLLYLRSSKAWSTHPKNYYAAESAVSEAGRLLFGKFLDFSWPHLALTASELQSILPALTAHDIVVNSQLVLALLKTITTKEVDWLSWEDPFIRSEDLDRLKLERESDPQETEKRLGYILPEIRFLFDNYRGK